MQLIVLVVTHTREFNKGTCEEFVTQENKNDHIYDLHI